MDAPHAPARAFACAGALLFAAALVYFLFSYSITFGESVDGRVNPGAIAINVGLFSIFALHHSVFARDAVREFVRRTVSAPLERSVYVWVASLMLVGVCYAWRPVPGVAWQLPAPWNWAIVVVQLAGVWLSLRGAAVIDAFDLAELGMSEARYLRIVDLDGGGEEPSVGFDLDAVGLVHYSDIR